MCVTTYKGSVNYRAFWVETNGAVLASSFVDGVGVNARWTLTDGDMTNTGGKVRFAFGGYDAKSGIGQGTSGNSNVVMSFSLGSAITNNFSDYSAALSSISSAGAPSTNVWSFASAFAEDTINNLIAAPSNQAWVTIPDTDADRLDDRLTVYSQSVGWLTVLDDDTNAPSPLAVAAVSNLIGTARMIHITTNNATARTSGDTTNQLHSVSDGTLNELSAANPLRFTLGVSDVSGVHRGTAGLTNMALTIGSAIVSNVANWSAGEGTPNATVAGASTNVWRFETLDLATRDALFAGQTNVVTATIPDADRDRNADSMTNVNQQYGFLAVYDDDTTGPTMGGISIGVDEGQTDGVAISEYIEGSSNNKALEIYNGTLDDIDLGAQGYAVWVSYDSQLSTNKVDLVGILPAKGVFVIAHGSAIAGITSIANQTHGFINWNGDDAVSLVRGGVVLDVIGQYGMDPGTAWTSGGGRPRPI